MSFSDRFGCEQESLTILHVVFAVLVAVRVTVHVLFRHSLFLFLLAVTDILENGDLVV